MTEKNGANGQDEVKVDGVVNELRSVLSGLGRVPAPSEPAVPPASEDKPISEPLPPPAEHSIPSGLDAPQPDPLSEPLASDADFWNGNVLGWPANNDADLPEIPALSGDPGAGAPGSSFFRDTPPDTNFLNSEPEPEPEPAPAVEAEEPKIFLPPVPEPIEKQPDAWPLVQEAEDIIPPVPPAPVIAPASLPPAPPAPKPPAPTANPWLQPAFAVEPPPAERAPTAPPADTDDTPPLPPPVAPNIRLELELPIPGTKETKDKPGESMDSELELEGKDLKPTDLVQFACFFPAGEERTGQTFVSKLKDSAEKLRAPMSLEAVFVSAWSQKEIDFASWVKSAMLAGADSILVLTSRSNAGLFSEFSAIAAKQGARSRIVFTEHVNLPTLYADVLVEFRRKR